MYEIDCFDSSTVQLVSLPTKQLHELKWPALLTALDHAGHLRSCNCNLCVCVCMCVRGGVGYPQDDHCSLENSPFRCSISV